MKRFLIMVSCLLVLFSTGGCAKERDDQSMQEITGIIAWQTENIAV